VLAQAGRPQEAEQAYRQAVDVSEKLIAEFPRDADYCENLGWTCDLLSGLLWQRGRALEAEQLQRDRLSYWEKLVNDIGMPIHRERLGEACIRLGELFRNSGRTREAATFFRKGQAVYERLVADPHPDPWDLRELAGTDLYLGHALCALKDSGWQEEAEKAYRRSASLGERLVAYFPNTRDYKERLTSSYTLLARFLCETGRLLEAEQVFAQAVKIMPDDPMIQYRHALAGLGNRDLLGYRSACGTMVKQFARAEEPETAFWVAWTCALAPESVEDLGACVGLGERAVAGSPKDPRYLGALGAVLYRAGRFKEAVERLDEANAAWEQTAANPTVPSPADTWFFLAMAHHRLGHAAEARAGLDKGIKWAKNASNETSPMWNRRLTLQLLRAEAESLVERQPK
jgi:tetratricopeptide (TPR) repeat protein